MSQRAADGAEQIEAWAAAAADGDSDAMAQLYERYADSLYRFVIVRANGDHSRSEDVCSDVWLRVVRAIGKYQTTRAGFPAWLYAIARNTLADSYRRSGCRPETPTADMLHLNVPSFEVTPEEAALRADTAERLAEAMRTLPKRQSRCLVLRFFNGLTVAETASVMGTTIGAVKVSQHRGLKALAKILPDEMRILGASLSVSHVQVVEPRGAQLAPRAAT